MSALAQPDAFDLEAAAFGELAPAPALPFFLEGGFTEWQAAGLPTAEHHGEI